jgi:PAS domain S-box-containing protein
MQVREVSTSEMSMNDLFLKSNLKPIAAWFIVLVGLYLSSCYNYLLFHGLAEFFSIIIAGGIFMVAWNARKFIENDYLLLLGIAYLFVGGIDLIHTFAYKGMNIFPGFDANLPTQLWISARYIESFSILLAPLFLTRRLDYRVATSAYMGISMLALLSIFRWGIFPDAFIEGAGLTAFKVTSEYIISALLLVSLFLLLRRKEFFDAGVLRLLAASILITVASEMAFTLYTDLYGFLNMAGHYLKIVSFYLIYKALIETGLARPYSLLFRNLKQSEEALRESEEKYRSLFTNMNEGSILHEMIYDNDGNAADYLIKDVNPRFEEILGITPEEAKGKRASVLYGTDKAPYLDIYAKVAETGEPTQFETYFPPMDKHFNISAFSPALGQFATVFTDITQRKQAKELSDALNNINAAINSTLDFDEIMERVVVESAKAIGAETAAISLREGDGWVVRYAYGLEPQLVGTRLTDEENSHAMLAVRLRAPVAISDAYNDERVNRQMMQDYGVRSVLVSPLVARDEIIGALLFNHLQSVVRFSDVQVDFANKLSASVLLALENSRLYGAERKIADTLQTAILTLPGEIQGIDYGYVYRSATEIARIGGDFYDIFELDEERVGFVVGDVSGKGIGAATITSMVKSTIRAFAYRDPDPQYVLTQTNNAIERQMDEGQFVTAVYGVIDTANGEVVMGSAGHPDPFKCTSGSCAQEKAERNPPLGIFPDVRFKSFAAKLNIGDTLVLYTDGLIEAKCDGKLYGDGRVKQVLDTVYSEPTTKMVQALLASAEKFSQDNLTDDIALVAIRYIVRGAAAGNQSDDDGYILQELE